VVSAVLSLLSVFFYVYFIEMDGTKVKEATPGPHFSGCQSSPRCATISGSDARCKLAFIQSVIEF
jgi:hypothetical protein